MFVHVLNTGVSIVEDLKSIQALFGITNKGKAHNTYGDN